MHAFYCRLLHLHHDHAADSISAMQPPTPRADPVPRTRPASAHTPPPGPRKRDGVDPDHRPSLHALVVPRLLDSGYTLDQITDLTGMPRALVELIADEHGPADVTLVAAATAKREIWLAGIREVEQARRRRTRAVALIVWAGVFNIGAGIASVMWHIPTLGAVATLGSFLLILAVFILSRRGSRKAADRSDPPQ